jgi:Nucleotide modification associated domain 2
MVIIGLGYPFVLAGLSPDQRIYYYILRVDDGAAPCVDRGIFTLAICKPAIRRKAVPGDWVLGIAPKAKGWPLTYVAQVRKKIRGEDYYSVRTPQRRDQIYAYSHGSFKLRHRKVHNSSNFPTDIGNSPSYPNAWVLIGSKRKLWYWGRNAKPLSEFGYFPSFIRKLGRLTQGHRVNHSEAVRKNLENLLRQVTKRRSGVQGEPRDSLKFCSEDEHDSKYYGVC